MSRLDSHVAAVRNKMALGTLLGALSWSLLIFAGACFISILVEKLFWLKLPRQMLFFWCGLGAASLSAAVWAVFRRPTPQQAAVAIDDRLALQEKFSTALYARSMNDPFAAAAVKDAERTADNVSLQSRFPVRLPFHGIFTIVAAVLVFMCTFLPQRTPAKQNPGSSLALNAPPPQMQQKMREAIAAIDGMPPAAAQSEEIKNAKRELSEYLHGQPKDPTKAISTAERALQDVNAVKAKIENAKNYALAENDMKVFRSMGDAADTSTPVGKAHEQIKKGEFSDAVKNLNDAVKKFDKMDKAEQQKTADAMKNLAQQLQQAATSPAAQAAAQKQLQQMGASQKQAQQMAQQMQAAAAGDKGAQQQLQQQANQLMQQMNQGAGPNAQQQQQMQQMMQQMQGQASNQQQAAALAQAAQQMAQAMKQQANGQAQQQPGQQQPGQQQQPGAQNPQANAQQMQAAQKQMQQAMQQMQQQQQAAQAQAAAQQQQNGQGQGQGQNGQQQGSQPGQQAGNNPGQGNPPGQGPNGQQNNGNMQQGQGQGQGGQNGGVAMGGKRPDPLQAAYSTTREVAPSQTDEKGKILASSFVKAGIEKGESKAQLEEAMRSEFNESTDEVQQDRIPANVRESVKDYFDSVKQAPK